MSTRHRARLAGAVAMIAGLAATTTALTAPPSTSAPAARPNLSVQVVTGVPDEAEKGGRFAVSAFLVNDAPTAAGASKLTAYFSRDRLKSGDDAQVGRAPAPRMAGHSVGDRGVRVTVPSGASGFYFVIVCADTGGAVRESNERDNCGYSSSKVRIVRPYHGELSGSFDLTDNGSLTDNMGFNHTWEREGQLDIALDVKGYEGTLSRQEMKDLGSGYDLTGLWTSRFHTPECVVTMTRAESGSGGFGTETLNVLSVRFEDSDLKRLKVSAIVDNNSSITHDLCEEKPTWEETHPATIEISLERSSRTGTTSTYEVTSFGGEPAETGPWDTIAGSLRLVLDD